MKAEITINSEGGVHGKSNFSLTGWQYDMYLSLDGLSNKEASDALKSRFSELNYETANINNFKNNRNDALLSFDFDYQAKTIQRKLVRTYYFGQFRSMN